MYNIKFVLTESTDKFRGNSTRGHGHINDIVGGIVDRLLYNLHSVSIRQSERIVGRAVIHALVDVARAPLENDGFGAGFQFPIRATAFTRRHPWHFGKALVERQVVADGVLPVAGFHLVVGVAGADGGVNLGKR